MWDVIKNVWQILKNILRYIRLLKPLFSMSNSHRSLRNKVVLITGASSGIGESTAHLFYQKGCHVILTARRMDKLEKVKNDLLNNYQNNHANKPLTMYLDLCDTNSAESVVKKIIDMYGHIDILINNGGISYKGKILNTNLNVYMKLMMTNFYGQIAVTKAVLPQMMERKSGHIVFMNSLQSKIALPYRSAYGASKHALQAFSDALYAEVAKLNIKVSAICPTYVKTSIAKNALRNNGTKSDKNDESIEKGLSPELVAKNVLDAVINEKYETTICPFYQFAFYCLRPIFPFLYFEIMSTMEREMCEELDEILH